MRKTYWDKCQSHELARLECLDILRAHEVGRLVFDDGHGPMVLPVNYAMQGQDILIRTDASGSIARHATDKRVAFEVDEVDDISETGCSVVVRGTATQASPESAPPDDEPYAWAEGVRLHVLHIHTDRITGRRLAPV